jgi:2-dehydropantoate 2-reductase
MNQTGIESVAVIGAGAVGMLLAASLFKAGINPVLYTRRNEQADLINAKGLTVMKEQSNETFSIEARCIHNGVVEKVVFIAVKEYQVHSLMDTLHVSGKTVVFLQNGMGHIDLAQSLEAQNIYIGSVEHGALKLSEHSIRHTGEGCIRVGLLSGNTNLQSVWRRLNDASFPIHIEENWLKVVKQKLIINAVINPLTALFRVKNGGLIENKHYFELMKTVFEETYSVLQVGNKDEMWKRVTEVCEKTASNSSSMYKDTEAGRKTEVDSIIGWILKEAKKQETSLPLLTFLYTSIKGIEFERSNHFE